MDTHRRETLETACPQAVQIYEVSPKSKSQGEMLEVERVVPNAFVTGPSHRFGDKPIHHTSSFLT
jgi:hypothetical protein